MRIYGVYKQDGPHNDYKLVLTCQGKAEAESRMKDLQGRFPCCRFIIVRET